MFAARTLTAAALLAAFIGAVWFLERGYLALLVGAIVAWGAHEWASLLRMRSGAALLYAAACAAIYSAVAAWMWPVAASVMPMPAILIGALLFWALAAPLWLAYGMQSSSRALLSAAGITVLVPAGLAMIALPRGLLLALLGLAWVSDTAAYLVGRSFGRHKLAPKVSPGKTIEGAAGAIVASVAYAVILAASMPAIGAYVNGFAWAAYVAGAGVLCICGIIGDLFESLAKRHAGVKDSGKLLPGHGGVLDRIDSLCAVLPIGALLVSWAGAA
ncbi:MAG TPA: phosphatidate cytidylyltransferase [Burkholderiales bacterium]|nr:phosphatidate cytidylyltransferase [Burkholderiales bacterium]